MMRFSFRQMAVLTVCLALVLSAPALARAEDKGLLSKLDIEASGSVDFTSRYVWRGFTLDKDPVVQPSISLSSKGFTFTFWSSWDADNNDATNSDEIDYTFDYTKEFDEFNLSLGHTYYDFPGTNGYSREFYIGFGLERLPILDLSIAPSLTYYHDYGDEADGGSDGDYLELALSYSKTLLDDPELSLSFGVAVGYNNELAINGDGGQVTLTAGFSVPLTENLTASPNANFTIPFGDLSDASDGNQDEIFWGGVSLAYTF